MQPDGKVVLAGVRSPISEWYLQNVFLLRYLTEPFVGVEDGHAAGFQMISADARGVMLFSNVSTQAEYYVTNMLGELTDHGHLSIHAYGRSQIDFGSPLHNGAYVITLRDGVVQRSLRFVVTH